MSNTKTKAIHIKLDPKAEAALAVVQSALQASGSRGSVSDAVRYAVIKTSRTISEAVAA